jgi:hypothetical protein
MAAVQDRSHSATELAAAARSRASDRSSDSPLPLDRALGRLWDETRGLINDHLLLASLEARSAARSLLRVVLLGVAGAALVLGAWGVLMAALLMWLLDAGVSTGNALAIVGIGTLLLAGLLFVLARQAMRGLLFPATLRRLASAPLPQVRE